MWRPARSQKARSRRLAGAALVGIGALAFAVRAIGFEQVFAGDSIVFPVGDAYYHLRRALFSLEHFPAVLSFDPLVSFPDGGWIVWPPLHDLLLAGLGRLLGGSRRALELGAAWLPPVLGALAVVPVYAAGATLGRGRVAGSRLPVAGSRLGLGAALLYALLPAGVRYSAVGNADHHCTVAFLGALWLAGSLACAAQSPTQVRIGAAATLVIARLGILLTWPGSLLYLALADGAGVSVEALRGRTRPLAAYATGLVVTALLVAPFIERLRTPIGGPFSAGALSWLQPLAMVALAAAALGCAALQRRRPEPRVWARALRSLGIAAATGALLLLVPGLLSEVQEALVYVGKGEPWAARNAEQLPLLRPSEGLAGLVPPLVSYGALGYLIPLVPLAALWHARDERVRGPALVLAFWTAGFGSLAALQMRYGSDFAPAAGVGFALLLAQVGGALRERLRPRAATGVAVVGLAVVAASLLVVHGEALRHTLAGLRAAATSDPMLATAAGTLHRFAGEVRDVTPATPGFADPTAAPAYGIITPPNVGHVIHYVGERATPADNFGPYSGSRLFGTVRAFYGLRSEREALSVARGLGARYVLTMDYGQTRPGSLAHRLHQQDGRGQDGVPRYQHFRLVAEGPRGGRALSYLFGGVEPTSPIPYKLFEIVPGAILEARGVPGDGVRVRVKVQTPAGRRFVYEARGQIGASGKSRLRVPYATQTATPVRTLGPVRVRIGAGVEEVEIHEEQVRAGAVIPVGHPPEDATGPWGS